MELNINAQRERTIDEKINSLIDYTKIDLDNEYYKLLEIAIECGMSVFEFWNGDIVMFAIYSNAYINRLHKQAFTNGLYFDTSLQVEIGNVFLEKGKKPNVYPDRDIYNPLNNAKEKEQKQQEKNALYNDNKKAFHIKAIINSRRKEEK